MLRYVGIDLHKRLMVVCILDERGTVIKWLRIEEVTQESVTRFAREQLRSEDVVVIEVTTNTWHLLTTKKPYRYAKPESVKAKLDRLRVAGSGVRRRGGAGKGVDARTMYPPEKRGMKRTPSLPDVMRQQGLAAPTEPKAGERKVLQNTQTEADYESLQKERLRPKKQGAPPATDMTEVIRQFNESS